MGKFKRFGNRLLLSALLFFMSAGTWADNGETGAPQRSPTSIAAKSLESRITGYFSAIEDQLDNDELISALALQDQHELQTLSSELETVFPDNPKVRLIIRGKEDVDYAGSPPCGYACIDIARQSYTRTTNAESVMFKSNNANIILARAVKNEDKEVLGAIVVQYPYTLIRDAMSSLNDTDEYIEFNQSVAGKKVALIRMGDKSLRIDQPKHTFRIKNTRWSISTWPDTSMQMDISTPASLPWLYIIAGAVIFLIIVVFLIVFMLKRKKSAEKPPTPATPENKDEGHRTIIFGGGASDVDVSDYLSQEDVTNIQKHTTEKD